MGTRFQWHRRRRARIAFWLLPALLFRAAIPAGFMPMVEDGRLSIVFCPGEVAARPISDVHAAHHHRSHLRGELDEAEPAPGQQVPCPFALGAAPVPPPALLVAASPAPQPGHVPAQITTQLFSPAIVRAQAARAPPASPNY